MARRSEVIGIRELENTIKELGKLPQKCVTRAARNGAKIALADARQNAPVDTGNLKRALKLVPEKTRRRGRKVFQVSFDRSYNDVFVKISAEGKRSYYPVSQEYGYFAVNGRFIPGFHYLRNSIDDNEQKIEKTMVDVLAGEIDKLR